MYWSQGWESRRVRAWELVASSPSLATMTATAPRMGIRAAVPGKGVAGVYKKPLAAMAASPAAAASVRDVKEASRVEGADVSPPPLATHTASSPPAPSSNRRTWVMKYPLAGSVRVYYSAVANDRAQRRGVGRAYVRAGGGRGGDASWAMPTDGNPLPSSRRRHRHHPATPAIRSGHPR